MYPLDMLDMPCQSFGEDIVADLIGTNVAGNGSEYQLGVSVI
jgi:hypothetical protein